MDTAGEIEQIRTCVVGIHLMQAHHVDAELGKPLCDLLRVLMGTEVHTAVEQGAEEAGDRAVLKHQLIPLSRQKTVLSRRFLLLKQKGNIQRSIIPVKRIRNIS